MYIDISQNCICFVRVEKPGGGRDISQLVNFSW